MIWFPAKRYGWGWGLPIVWQGWVVLILWLATLLVVAPYLATRSRALFIIFIVSMSAALISVCYAKGERPRWRWGK